MSKLISVHLKPALTGGTGNEIIIEKGYDNLNYTDANGWMRAVDTKLKPSADGWSAEQQEIPVYLYHDGSTALSLGGGALMTFNKNVQFNGQGISINNYTAGDNGMYIKNVAPNTDKIIRFGRGRVETDYRINQPVKLNGDLIISEDISLPAGYTISENTNYDPETDAPGSFIVTGTNGKTVAELKSPLCYDSRKNSILGSYHIQKQAGGYRLEVAVPAAWINDPLRQYPVTIDPVVNGPLATYSGGIIPSCVYPQFDTASIVVTIPGKITITNFFVQGEYYTPVLDIKYGFLSFQTSCLISPIIYPGADVQNGDTDLPGWVYAPLAENDLDAFSNATCCYQPSCSPQTFRLIMGIARDTIDTAGCNARYFYYDPSNTDGEPFEAYIVGHTVESSYSVPSPICANQCTLTMADSVHYGVPPYTITHPWMSDTITIGSYSTNDCTSKAGVKLNLTIPNCPGPSCIASSLTIPPPRIVDACGDTVALLSKTITVNAVPVDTVTPDSQSVCSGTPISFSLSSCVAGATYAWTNSEGGSGSGNPLTNTPNNNTSNAIVVQYFVTATANGCTGPPTIAPVAVTPFTVTVSPDSASICEGNSVDITTSGEATVYSWMPASGLNCTTCSNPQATPSISTTYTVKGTNGGACSATDSIVILVGPKPTLTVSKDTTIILGHSTHLYATTGDSVKVTWSPSTGLSSTTGDTVLASPSTTTTYTVSATDGPCTITAEVVVIVEATFVVPSAFTPNSGNSNSRLYVLPNLITGLTLQQFRVYNRWGQMVFETSDITDGWDGTFNGKPQPMGTYVYYVQYLKEGQATSTIAKGNVTLIR